MRLQRDGVASRTCCGIRETSAEPEQIEVANECLTSNTKILKQDTTWLLPHSFNTMCGLGFRSYRSADRNQKEGLLGSSIVQKQNVQQVPSNVGQKS